MRRNCRKLSASRSSWKTSPAQRQPWLPITSRTRPRTAYTLVVLTSIALSINPTLFKQLNYDPQDFTPISLYVKSPFVLVIDPSLPAKTLLEFVELAKTANPPLNYASIGAGSVQHMSMEF